MSRQRGLTIIEVLVVLGIAMLLLSLALPLLGRTRDRGTAASAMARTREMAIGTQMYADFYAGLPPVYAAPQWPPRGPWRFDFGTAGGGNWFEHVYFFSYGVTAVLGNVDVAVMPGNPRPFKVMEHGGVPVRRGDFALTDALYADPRFFNWNTQTGPDQFVPQRLDSTSFPSAKGMLYPIRMYHHRQFGTVLTCCAVDLPAPIAFFDLSVRELIMRRLKPGMLNLYADVIYAGQADPREHPGPPVVSTVDGLRGRDTD